jgi:hypothetical protein
LISDDRLGWEDRMIYIIMGGYGCIVGGISWGIISMMDYLRDKRSKKIII